MTKKEFYDKVRDTYFEEATCNLEEFKMMLLGAMPVFGELETKVEKDKDNITITFIDRDEANEDFVPPEGMTRDDFDMSCRIITLYLGKDGTINVVENGLSIFTTANKDTVLFLGSLIGKKIEL